MRRLVTTEAGVPKKGYKQTEEHKQKSAELRRVRFAKPEFREKMTAVLQSEKSKQHAREGTARFWADPANRAEMSKSKTDEHKSKLSIAARAQWAAWRAENVRRAAAGLPALRKRFRTPPGLPRGHKKSPEAVAKQAEALTDYWASERAKKAVGEPSRAYESLAITHEKSRGQKRTPESRAWMCVVQKGLDRPYLRDPAYIAEIARKSKEYADHHMSEMIARCDRGRAVYLERLRTDPVYRLEISTRRLAKEFRHTEDSKRRIGESNAEAVQRRLASGDYFKFFRDTWIERGSRCILSLSQILYENQAKLVGKRVDILITDGPYAGTVLEADGEYYHAFGHCAGRFTTEERERRFLRQVRRDQKLAAAGYRVVRMWEADLKADLYGTVMAALEGRYCYERPGMKELLCQLS